VAKIMTGFRPIESKRLPKIGLSMISNTAAKLDNDDKIDVALSEPKRSIRIGGGDNATNITDNVIKNDDINKGVNDTPTCCSFCSFVLFSVKLLLVVIVEEVAVDSTSSLPPLNNNA